MKTRTSEWFAAVRRAGKAGRRCQARDFERPREAAHVADVRLHDVDHLRLDHTSPHTEVPVLLAAGDVELERLGHLTRPVELPVRAGLLEVRHSVALEHPPDGDRPGRRVAAVRVDEDRHLVSERRADALDDSLCAPRPFIGVVPALLADAHLDRVEPVLLA